MNDPAHRAAQRLLLGAAALLALLAIVAFLVIARSGAPTATATADSPAPSSSPSDAAAPATHSPTPGAPPRPAPVAPSPTAAPPTTPLARTPEGRIDPASLATFTPQPNPSGPPAYDGEPVTAYIAVPSTGRRTALSINQLGKFPRALAAPGEQVEIRVVFSTTPPATPIALAVRDGGKLHTGKSSAALALDDARQLAFAFTVSDNPGTHRITVTTPAGEIKTLEFWAGPPAILMQAAK